MANQRKYISNKQSYAYIRRTSDRLCRENGLSVVKPGKDKGKSYAEWYIQKHGLSATDHGYVAWNGGELRYEYSDLGGSPMTAQTM